MCSQVLCIGYFVCYHVDKIPLFFNVNYSIFAVFVFSNQISRGRCQLREHCRYQKQDLLTARNIYTCFSFVFSLY